MWLAGFFKASKQWPDVLVVTMGGSGGARLEL